MNVACPVENCMLISSVQRYETGFVGTQILPMLLSTKSACPQANISFLRPYFHHGHRKTNAGTILRQSSLYRRCGTPYNLPADSIFLRQLSARLHIYSALPLEVRESEFLDEEGSDYVHPYARSRVYDLRRYKLANDWGPFMDDGPPGNQRIDWEKVQSIWLVLGYGLRMLSERTDGSISGPDGWGMGINGEEGMWEGLGANSFEAQRLLEKTKGKAGVEEEESIAATAGSSTGSSGDEEDRDARGILNGEIPPLEWYEERFTKHRQEAVFQRQQAEYALQDPYGVTGTWMRIVNFLDYQDLFAFNFTGQQDLPESIERGPVTTAEAFRLIMLTLWITKIEWPDEEEAQPEDWETLAGSSASQGFTPAPTTAQEDATTVPLTTPASNAEARAGHTDEDGLYHKPPSAPSSPTNPIGIHARTATVEVQPSSTPKPKTKAKYPTVHFEGRSRSLHIRWDPNANSHIRGKSCIRPPIRSTHAEVVQGSNPFYNITGTVRAYPSPPVPPSEFRPDDNLDHVYPAPSPLPSRPFGLPPEDDPVIRWTTFSVFHGEPRWKSEGVQIGGFKSARGILGNWFDKDFDAHGPAGPTGFWKISENCERFPGVKDPFSDGGFGGGD